MVAKDLASTEIPTVSSTQTIAIALHLLDEYRMSHIPLVNRGKYSGLLDEKELSGCENPNALLPQSLPFAPHAVPDSHLFEILDIMAQNRITHLPVISDGQMYEGVVSRQALLSGLAVMCHAGEPGAILLLETLPHEYSIAEIGRLIEENNCTIINLLTYPNGNTGRLYLSVKVDCEDATPLIRTLERFNYRVTACMQQQEVMDDTLQRRVDELIHYIEM